MEQPQSYSKNDHLPVPFMERLKSLPGLLGIRLGEEPIYDLLKSDGDFEVRKYDSLTLASITLNQEYDLAMEEGLRRLSGYIYGQNSSQQEMKTWDARSQEREELSMIYPVLRERSEAGWTISFVLPRHLTLTTAPRPEDTAIYLHRESPRFMATLRYGGHNDLDKFESKTRELQDWLSQNREFRVVSSFRCAEYDGPLTIPFLRRNEVLVRVDKLLVQ